MLYCRKNSKIPLINSNLDTAIFLLLTGTFSTFLSIIVVFVSNEISRFLEYYLENIVFMDMVHFISNKILGFNCRDCIEIK